MRGEGVPPLFKGMIIMRKILSRILITVGIILIGIALYQKLTTTYYQNKLVKEYEAYINALKDKDLSGNSENEDANTTGESTEELSNTASPEEINVIEIPPVKIEFDLANFLKIRKSAA